MLDEPFPPSKYCMAELVRCISILEIAIIALVSFLTADRAGLLCKVPAFEWPSGCGIRLPLSSGVRRTIREVGFLVLFNRNNFDQDRSLRAYGVIETADCTCIACDDPFLNFDWESGAA